MLNKLSIPTLRIVIIAIATITYCAYLYVQYVDLFFESQFLHIPFLKDLAENNFSAKGFFTVYGEHTFPGYNILLALNYYLFNVWGGFDSIAFMFSLFGIVFVVTTILIQDRSRSNISLILILIFTCLTLFSTSTNPQWGMALAASFGVLFFTICLYKISISFTEKEKISQLPIFGLIIISIVLFLGGYAVGMIASLLFLILHHTYVQKRLSTFTILLSSTIAVSVIIYIVIVSHYSSLSSNSPLVLSFEPLEAIKFFLIMTGSSILGRAFFELFQTLIPFYICGFVLIAGVTCYFYKNINKPSKEFYFISGLAIYSITNILIVSLFRYKNGIEGGMGQWYNVHTHFLALVVFLYLIDLIKSKAVTTKILSYCLMGFLFLAASMSYVIDFKKAMHVSGWKTEFLNQAPLLLANPDKITDKNDSKNTMLWNYNEAKTGIDFLYSKSLWIFEKRKPLKIGIAEDNWVEGNKQTMIICPYGTTKIKFNSWRSEDWKPSELLFRTHNKSTISKIENSENSVNVDSKNAFIEFIPTINSNPVSSSSDPRQLIFIVSNISCELCSCNDCSSGVSSEAITIAEWGPMEAKINENPNPQPDNGIGFWIRVSTHDKKILTDEIEVHIGNEQAKSLVFQDGLLTLSVSTRLTSAPGLYDIQLKTKSNGNSFYIGQFIVR
jgi:hypothetical protein